MVYQSKHIENEVGIAFSRSNKGENITILPVEIGDFIRLQDTWVEYYLIHTQSVKMPQPDKQNVEKLIRKTARILDAPPPKPQPVQPPTAQPQTRTRKPAPQPQSGQPSANIIESGECGYNVTYTLDSNGALTISGAGAMWNYYYNTMPWYQKRHTIYSIRIEDGVISVGASAFVDCDNLSGVSVSTKAKIKRNAFPADALICYY